MLKLINVQWCNTMKPKWLIDDHSFAEDTNPLFDALRNQGIEYKTCEGSLSILEGKSLYDYFPPNDCVITYACLDVAKYIRRNTNWIPGVYYTPERYNCTSYYPVFGEYLLNSNYIMLPFGELIRRKEYLYEKLGQDRCVFIRPNRGDKIFTGQVVEKEYFEKDVGYFGFYDVAPDELVVVAEPYNIEAEWRLIIVNNKPITASLYKENNIVGSEPGCPPQVYTLANKLALMYSPDTAWVMDICRTKGGEYKLLEIGCFSCAGLYQCDRNDIVREVSLAAIDDWNQYQ